MADFSWQPPLSAGAGSSSIMTVTAEVHSEPMQMLAVGEPEESVQRLLQAISLEDGPAVRKSTRRGRCRKRKPKVVRRDSSVSDNEILFSEPLRTRRTRSEEPKAAKGDVSCGPPRPPQIEDCALLDIS